MDGSDLWYHCLCLVWQLSSNYALLGRMDKLGAESSLVLPKNASVLVWRCVTALIRRPS